MANKALQGGRRENRRFLAVLLKKVWYFILNILNQNPAPLKRRAVIPLTQIQYYNIGVIDIKYLR
jgi:hypothetical protein